MNVKNITPFATERMVVLDKAGAERLVLVVKPTFAISKTGELSVSEEQPPVVLADEFRGDPDVTSIVHEAELAPCKPATDLVLIGSARAPSARAQSVDVTFRIGENGRTIRVFGDRLWASALGMVRMTAPAPFESIPLVWERAFGGRDLSPENPAKRGQEARNPVGVGFRARESRAAVDGTRVPNLEDPASPIKAIDQRVAPQGFSYIGRSWSPRLQYAGTYDDTWLAERMPLLPLDFDERYFNAAPPGMTAAGHLQGGEPVLVEGCTPNGRVFFNLPRLALSVEVQFRFGREPIEMRLDTVVVDSDAMQVRIVFKGELLIHRKLPELREIRVRQNGEA